MVIRIPDFMIFIAILSFVTIDLSVIGLLQKAILRLVLVGFAVSVWLKYSVVHFSLQRPRFVCILLLGLILLSTLWSKNPSLNILYAVDLVIYTFFISSYFLRFSHFSDWEMQLSLVNGVSYFLAVFLVLAIVHSSQFVHFDRTGFFRLGGHAINSNFLSVLCIIPVSFYLFSEKKFSCLRLVLHFCIPSILLVLSGSRAPTLLFLISIFLILLQSHGLYFLLVALLTVFVAVIVSSDFLILQFRLNSINDLITLTGRTEIWRDLLSNTNITSLLFGYGAFDVSSSVDNDLMVVNGHNSFINALLYAGSGALLLHFFLTFYVVKCWIRTFFSYPSKEAKQNYKFLLIFLSVILGMQMVEGAFVGRSSVLILLSVWVVWFISRHRYEEN